MSIAQPTKIFNLAFKGLTQLDVYSPIQDAKALILSGNPLESLDFFTLFPNLHTLFLDSQIVSQQKLDQLLNFRQLQVLTLREMELTNLILRSVTVAILDISRSQISNSFFTQLNMPNLEVVLFGQQKTPQNVFSVFKTLFLRFDKLLFAKKGSLLYENVLYSLKCYGKSGFQLRMKRTDEQQLANYLVNVKLYRAISEFEIQLTKQFEANMSDLLAIRFQDVDFKMKDCHYRCDPLNWVVQYQKERQQTLLNGGYVDFFVFQIADTGAVLVFVVNSIGNAVEFETKAQQIQQMIGESPVIVEKQEVYRQVGQPQPLSNKQKLINQYLQETIEEEQAVNFADFLPNQNGRLGQVARPKSVEKEQQQKIGNGVGPLSQKRFQFESANFAINQQISVNNNNQAAYYYVSDLTHQQIFDQVKMVLIQQNQKDVEIAPCLNQAIINYNQQPNPLMSNQENGSSFVYLQLVIGKLKLPLLMSFQKLKSENNKLFLENTFVNHYIMCQVQDGQSFGYVLSSTYVIQKPTKGVVVKMFDQNQNACVEQLVPFGGDIYLEDSHKLELAITNDRGEVVDVKQFVSSQYVQPSQGLIIPPQQKQINQQPLSMANSVNRQILMANSASQPIAVSNLQQQNIIGEILPKDRISVRYVPPKEMSVLSDFELKFRPNFSLEFAPAIFLLTQDMRGIFYFVQSEVQISEMENDVFRTTFQFTDADTGLLPFAYIQCDQDCRLVQLSADPLEDDELQSKIQFDVDGVGICDAHCGFIGIQMNQKNLTVVDEQGKAVVGAPLSLAEVFLPNEVIMSPSQTIYVDCANTFTKSVVENLTCQFKRSKFYQFNQKSREDREEFLYNEPTEDQLLKFGSNLNTKNGLLLRLGGKYVAVSLATQELRDRFFVYFNIFKNRSFLDVDLEIVGELNSVAVAAIAGLSNTEFATSSIPEMNDPLLDDNLPNKAAVDQKLNINVPSLYHGLLVGQIEGDTFLLPIKAKIPEYFESMSLSVVIAGPAGVDQESITQMVTGEQVQVDMGQGVELSTCLPDGTLANIVILFSDSKIEVKVGAISYSGKLGEVKSQIMGSYLTIQFEAADVVVFGDFPAMLAVDEAIME